MTAAIAPPAPLDEGLYLALQARDARFDGRFFTGVTSTGIYCRPVCRVRTPKRENCRFFALAAQAEAAGFRPCLRCRPELAPADPQHAPAMPWSAQDATSILGQQAAHLLDTVQTWCPEAFSMARVAARLGVSERHLRRVFEARWGVSPLQYLQTRRLLAAKHLLSDTRLPVGQIATLSGFASVRRFNTAFASHYRLTPSALRQRADQPATPADPLAGVACIRLQAAYRPPYDVGAMLAFFAARSLDGIELVDCARHTLTRTLALDVAGQPRHGWVQAQFVPTSCSVVLRVSESLAEALPAVLALCKALLDLDADPQAIDAVLGARFANAAGLRVPGTVDGFELAVRAIVGQQITVRAARTLGVRLSERFGTELPTPWAGLNRLFPSAQALAGASGDALGQLGIVRQRQQAIVALARAVAAGSLQLSAGADVHSTLRALQALPGIGPWTAHYIAMRALRWPDAFPCGDVALQRALGVHQAPHPAQAAEQASAPWKPWRSYAVVRAWASLPAASDPAAAAPVANSTAPPPAPGAPQGRARR